MKNNIISIILSAVAGLCSIPAFSQTEGDFRTTSSGTWSDISIWETWDGSAWRVSESQPGETEGLITIQQGHDITLRDNKTLDELRIEGSLTVFQTVVLSLSGNITVEGMFTVEGALLCGTSVVKGSGAFFLLPGATIQIGSPQGIAVSGNTGNIQTYNRLFSHSANFVYSGAEAQVTGNGLPAPRLCGVLTIDNRSGITLSRNTVIYKQLILSEGVLCLNGKSLTINDAKMVSRSQGSVSLCGGSVEGSVAPLLLNTN